MLPLIPILIASTAGYFGHREYKKYKAYTPERKEVFKRMMNSPTDPVTLRAAASTFEKDGLTKQADTLRKRAALREAPGTLKAARQQVFKKAMKSQDPDAIEQVAKAHEAVGAVGAAESLRIQAATLRSVK